MTSNKKNLLQENDYIDVAIIGGGAAGFFTAINIARERPNLRVVIFERGKTVLAKVKISGGGRCNVTNAEFDPNELVKNYPRGYNELLGPFHTFCTGDMVNFLEENGVILKIEPDGRVFPKSNSSQTVVDFFVNEADKLGVRVLKNSGVNSIEILKSGWKLTTMNKDYFAKKVVVATGGNPKVWKLLKSIGHSIVSPVPSLFTFNINDERLKGMQGISAEAHIIVPAKKIYDSQLDINLKSEIKKKPKLEAEGSVLITHWGLSGPAILRLSAWGAKILNDYNYNFRVQINWLPDYNQQSLELLLHDIKEVETKKTVLRTDAVEIPRRLWKKLVIAADIEPNLKWTDLSKKQIRELAAQLTNCSFRVEGKSNFKEEFVTAGGVDLKEVNFKTFESKIHPTMYFAGEVLNIDGITGGFNFQNAWTGAYIAAQGIISSY